MIKKIVCAALMLSILAMSSMGAFAAVTSSTEYGETGFITVTTTVDGVAEGDTVTYIAYKEATTGEGPTDSNIAYIDQDKCRLCRKCESVCPQDAIHSNGFPKPVEKKKLADLLPKPKPEAEAAPAEQPAAPAAETKPAENADNNNEQNKEA